MPKVYKLMGLMELLRMKEKQDARGELPVDWALEQTKGQLKTFFTQPLRGISGEGEGLGKDGAGCQGGGNSP